ncbi:MAG TPA: DMT family transporter [Planctomycetota bacterium]|nr:DMT family transporter [Planctomycetota bacterium]
MVPVAQWLPSPKFVGLLAVLAISSGAVFVRLAQAAEIPSLSIAALRLFFASAVLVPLVLVREREALAAMSRKQWGLAALSGTCLALHFGTWIASLETTSVATSVALVSTTPLWVALASPWLLKERISGRAWCGIAVAMGGALLIGLDQPSDGQGGVRLEGAVLAVLGAIAVGGYFMLGRGLRKSLHLLPYVAVTYGVAAVLLVVAAKLAGYALFDYAPSGLLACGVMALIPQLIGHTLYNWALRYVAAGTVAIMVVGEPIGCAILAAIVLSEYPGTLEAAGCGLLLLGILFVLRAPRRPVGATQVEVPRGD